MERGSRSSTHWVALAVLWFVALFVVLTLFERLQR